jgi:predicted TIM-barrel fold metal-dependent hydrolase
LHCHLASLEGRTLDEKMAKFIAIADRMGIARLVMSMGSRFSYEPSPDEFRKQNDELLEAITHWHHRVFPLCYINPKFPRESLAEIDRLIANGPCVGIKLWVAHRCHSEELDPVIRRCHELQALIFQHTWFKANGNSAGESTPMELAELAARHPQTPIILGHSGGDWEIGIRAVRGLNNVSVETAGFDPTAGMVEMAVRELGAERVIYGSDAPGRSFASQIAKVESAKLTPAERQAIFAGNLRRLLTPILQRKGIRE